MCTKKYFRKKAKMLFFFGVCMEKIDLYGNIKLAHALIAFLRNMKILK